MYVSEKEIRVGLTDALSVTASYLIQTLVLEWCEKFLGCSLLTNLFYLFNFI